MEHIQALSKRKSRDALRTRTKVNENKNKKYWNNSKKRRDSAKINMSHKNHCKPSKSNNHEAPIFNNNRKQQYPVTTKTTRTTERHCQRSTVNYWEPTNTKILFACCERIRSNTWLLLALLMLLKISLTNVKKHGWVQRQCWRFLWFLDEPWICWWQLESIATNQEKIWLW